MNEVRTIPILDYIVRTDTMKKRKPYKSVYRMSPKQRIAYALRKLSMKR